MAAAPASAARVGPHCGRDTGAQTTAEHGDETKSGENPSHIARYRQPLADR
jgi:hypothetical protein